MEPRFVVEIMPVNAKHRWNRVTHINWFPVPTAEQKRAELDGKRKTSPWMSFQPDCVRNREERKVSTQTYYYCNMCIHVYITVRTSSSSMASSSSSMYREKSFFKTRNRIMVKNAVKRSTRTKELMMDSQWISKEEGKNRDSAYKDMRFFHSSSSSTHSTE
jgi:hypothetical protein